MRFGEVFLGSPEDTTHVESASERRGALRASKAKRGRDYPLLSPPLLLLLSEASVRRQAS
eukprot:scaffold256160_cov30-Tisochrysis_lutea.AAC.1